MTKQEVKEKMRQFIDLILREKELREKLLCLNMRTTDRDELRKRIAEHDSMIAEIEDIRMKKVLPMMEEMAAFVSKRQKEVMEEKKAKGEEFGEKEYYTMLVDANFALGNDESFKKLIENTAPELLNAEFPE